MRDATGAHKESCEHVHALLMRLTERLRYEDAEVEVDRKQAQVEELQRVRLQLEHQVEQLAAKLSDVDAQKAQLKVKLSILMRRCNVL